MVSENRTKVEAWGPNRCERGSRRPDWGGTGRIGKAQRDKARHGTPNPPRPQYHIFVLAFIVWGPLDIRESCKCGKIDGNGITRSPNDDDE